VSLIDRGGILNFAYNYSVLNATGIGAFSFGVQWPDVKLIIHFNVVLRLRMSGVTAFMACGRTALLLFSY